MCHQMQIKTGTLCENEVREASLMIKSAKYFFHKLDLKIAYH